MVSLLFVIFISETCFFLGVTNQDLRFTSKSLTRFYEWGRGSGNFTLVGIQLVSILFVFGWTSVIFTPFCFVLKYLNWLRIDPLEEEVGMDISRHKGPAYESEGSANAEAIMELSASRRNLMDNAGSGRGSFGKSFKRDKPAPEKKETVSATEPKDEVTKPEAEDMA